MLKYRLLVWLTAIFWGGSFVATKVVIAQYPPVFVAAIRFGIAYSVLFLIQRKPSGARKSSVLWAGLWGITLYFLFENLGISLTSPTNAVLIISLIPVMHMIFFWIFGKTKIRRGQWIGGCIAFLGVGIVITNGQLTLGVHPLGDLLMFGACFAWILYTFHIINTHPDQKKRESLNTIAVTREVTFWGMIFLIPFSVGEMLVVQPPLQTLVPSLSSILGLLFLGVCCSSLGYVFWNLAIRHIGPQSTTNAIYLMPVITAFFEAVILNQMPSLFTIIGGSLVILGLMVCESNKKGKARLI